MKLFFGSSVSYLHGSMKLADCSKIFWITTTYTILTRSKVSEKRIKFEKDWKQNIFIQNLFKTTPFFNWVWIIWNCFRQFLGYVIKNEWRITDICNAIIDSWNSNCYKFIYIIHSHSWITLWRIRVKFQKKINF